MKYYKPIVFFVFLIIFYTPSYGQKNIWSLQRCLHYAKTHNIQLKQKELDVERGRIAFHQSRLSRLPSVNGAANYGRSFGRSIDPTTNQFVSNNLSSAGISLNAGITLFSFFKIRNTIKANKNKYKAESAAFQKIMNDVSLNVTDAYLQILLAKEQLKISKKQVRLTKTQLNNTVKKVNAGTLTESNKANLLAQLAEDKAAVIGNENKLKQSILQIKTLLNLDYQIRFIPLYAKEFAASLVDLKSFTPKEIYQKAVGRQPAIRADSLQILVSRRTLKIVKAGRYPGLTLNAQLGTNYSGSYRRPVGEKTIYVPSNPIGAVTLNGSDYVVHSLPENRSIPMYENPGLKTQLNDNLRAYVGISLSIPVFNGWQTKAQMKKAKINLQSQRLKLEKDLWRLKQNIFTAYFQAESTLQNYKAAKAALKATRTAFSYAKIRFSAGVINALEYLTVQNRLFKVESKVTRMYYSYVFQMKVLKFYQTMKMVF